MNGLNSGRGGYIEADGTVWTPVAIGGPVRTKAGAQLQLADLIRNHDGPVKGYFEPVLEAHS